MTGFRDSAALVGTATVRKYEPDVLSLKDAIEVELRRRGLGGMALELAALEELNKRHRAAPYEEVSGSNSFTQTGQNDTLVALIGNAITGGYYSNANGNLGVGDSSTANGSPNVFTDLQAASNKLRKAMDATFPSVAANVLTARSTFANADAVWVWNEWGFFNANAAGHMLNRGVQAMGTKTASVSWQLLATITQN